MDFDNSLDTISPDVASETITFLGTGSIGVPTGTTGQRPTGVVGMFRLNSQLSMPEMFIGATWKSLQLQSANLDGLSSMGTTGLMIRTGVATFTALSLTAPSAGITITNPDGIAGSPTFALSNDLGALEALASTGLAARTAADTWAQRAITSANSTRIVITNGNGVSGDPTIDLASGIVSPGTYESVTVDTYGRVTAGSATSSATITVQDEAVNITTTANTLNFQGSGVTVTGGSTATITIPGGAVITGTAAVTLAAGSLVCFLSENLIAFSSAFDNAAWTKGDSTITAGATVAPDGTTGGQKLVAAATANSHQVSKTVTLTGAGTFSVYAKAAEYNVISLSNGDAGVQWVHFQLTGSGTMSTLGTGIASASITLVGNGWYRCTIVTNSAGAWTNVTIAVRNAFIAAGGTNTLFTGNAASGVYIWGAQLNTGSTLLDYKPTSTVPTIAGQIGLADNTFQGREAIGFVKVLTNAAATATVYCDGSQIPGTSLLTGATYYLGANGAFVLSSAAPSSVGSGQILMKVGFALSTTILLFKPEAPITL